VKRFSKNNFRLAIAPALGCLLFAICLLPFAFAQSGRPLPPQQNPKPQQKSPAPPKDSPKTQNTEPQDDDNPVKLNADLVTAITSVTDLAGNQINNLSKDDFVVYEDNQPQDIEGIYKEGQLPLRLVFLFDTSSSIRSRFDFEQRAAAQFFRNVLRAGDQAAIISVASDPRLEIPLTGDVNRLVNTLGNMKAQGATALYSAMAQAARLLRNVDGRHVMVVLSDGTDTASGITLAQALTEVQRSDTVIYTVHSTGIAPSLNLQDLGGEYVLKAMAEDTGGKAFFPPIFEDTKKETRDLDEIYRRVAAEVRAQYVLTYYSKNTATKPFRRIRVEVKKQGLQVRARSGYYTTK
jgi:Ca-activated chloride channel family protein